MGDAHRRLPAAMAGLSLVPCTLFALALEGGAAPSGNWPQWRGPLMNGSSAETGLPTTFSRTENVLWRAAMPGPGSGTPVVWGDRVFVSSTDSRTKGLVALCYDVRTGRLLWRRETGRDRRAMRNNMASPSPIATADAAYFFYGTAGLFAFGHDGAALWQRDLERDHGFNSLMFGYSSSPMLMGDRLYVVAVRNAKQDRYKNAPPGRSDSYVLAIDRKTGRDVWKHVRSTDARGESQEAYVTAVPLRRDGAVDVLVLGADYLTAHDPDTGAERWRWGGYNPRKLGHWRIIPSPVAAGGIVFVPGPKYSTGFAVRPGGNGRLGAESVAWTFGKRIPDASTPLYYKGRLYVLDDNRKVLTCLDPETGKQHWQGNLETKAVIRASLTGADDKLYIMSEAHEALVISADEFKVLHRTKMGDEGLARSTIAAARGRLFVRAADALYCIGNRGPGR
ncbi:MAG: outer membrane protein assembly factor BamB family protein [Planctomycetota bacterium]